jgi:sugar lactone lactonase YvrE
MTVIARAAASLCIAAFLAGCGGGSVPGSRASGDSSRKGTALFRIRIPKKAAKHREHFISPSTQSVTVALAGPTTVNAMQNVTPTSGGCSASLASTICTFQEFLAPGNYTATIAAYDGTNGTGKELSAGQSLPFTVVAATTNAIGLTLAGIPARIAVFPGTSSTLANINGNLDMLGTSAHALLVQAFDADDNAIVGPGSPTYTIAQSSGSLAVTIGQPSATSPNTFTVAPPSLLSTSTAKLAVTAGYAGQATNGCALPGAVCSGSVVVDMTEIVASLEFNQVELHTSNQSIALATVTAGIANPSAIAFDSKGDLVVANCLIGCGNGNSTDLLSIYAPPYNGLPQILTNGVVSPRNLIFDASGNLFVAECLVCNVGGTDNVTQYAAPFSTSSVPAFAITSGVNRPGALALDSLGDLFVANPNNNQVRVYTAPLGSSSTPFATIAGLSNPAALALDASRNLYVANFNNASVTVYAPPYSALKVKLASTLANVNGLAIDAAGDVFVANCNTGCGNGANHDAVTEFSPPLTNISTPGTTITNGVNRPNAIVMDAAGTLFVANNNNTITVYSASNYTGTQFTLNLNGSASQLSILP